MYVSTFHVSREQILPRWVLLLIRGHVCLVLRPFSVLATQACLNRQLTTVLGSGLETVRTHGSVLYMFLYMFLFRLKLQLYLINILFIHLK